MVGWDLCVTVEGTFLWWLAGWVIKQEGTAETLLRRGQASYRAGALGECRLIWGENWQDWMKTSCGL